MQYTAFPSMHVSGLRVLSTILVCITMVMVLYGGCTQANRQVSSPYPDAIQSPGTTISLFPAAADNGLTIRVGLLARGDVLPDVYTCKGTGDSPPISWSGAPVGTKSLVLILEDPDAPAGTFTHWLLYNIPLESGELTQAQPRTKVLSNGAQQGESSSGERGYYPPCPPPGSTHRYIFRMYALDWYPALPAAGRNAIEQALENHTLGTAEFATTFGR